MLWVGLFTAQAQQTYSLAWNANPEPDIVSYRVHVGNSSRQYNRVYTTTSPSVDVSDLPQGTYYFAVTAVNAAGLESAYSGEVSNGSLPTGPVVTSVLTATAIRLTVQTVPSAVIAFESSTNLRDWHFFANLTANAVGVATLNQTRNTAAPALFFRFRVP
jgi:hypothetical protein